MSKGFSWLALFLILLIVLFYTLVDARTAAIEADGRARAMIIQAQAESRLHTAQAEVLTLVATLPWGVLDVVGVVGLGYCGSVRLGFALGRISIAAKVDYRAANCLFAGAGQRRAEIWQALQASREGNSLLVMTGRKNDDA